MGMGTTERIADLHARSYVAGIVGAIAVAGSASVAGLAGQLPAWAAFAVVGSMAILAAGLVRRLLGLTLRLREGLAEALHAVDSLMVSEGEVDVDETEAPHES